jgi:hypothetical protein
MPMGFPWTLRSYATHCDTLPTAPKWRQHSNLVTLSSLITWKEKEEEVVVVLSRARFLCL